MSRFGPRGPRRRYVASPPRSHWRKLLDYGLAILLLGLLILVAARLDRFERRQEQGTAIVNDGDSITLGAERIRMRGIDAPEYQQTCQKAGADYPCGKLARQSLVRLIAGRPVVCSGWRRDRYGRLLGDCKAGDTDLNQTQVQAGWGCLRRFRDRGSSGESGQGRHLGRHLRGAAGLARQPSWCAGRAKAWHAGLVRRCVARICSLLVMR
ncbi:thermonuclease family protein [Mesorhizobium sp. CA10]|uniref:thermonuclease family protein n=1 Tax=Mesorhizobium sp. CA10 TaxID=588495 RepID=UPI001CCAFA7D|nr:thermonuclease family protein [Mesorhizobium sp. CA10]MBZ9885973.1 thermonuclease family protein [Mesorhizobium sp. CA10]